MYLKNIVIDGFKSYGKRTEINGFDPQFNAITGLNGSGKSNILDAICFLLGITNLSQVRAQNLQELVYKSGQAGVVKATVTISFDNTDKSQSPVGHEDYDEITITRQVVIGGKNKYLLNGINVQNNRIQDLFQSVQLNVNNPHFLIMQGRITKVLNMKPPEILAMMEEAAGTRMYETKKLQAQKTIEKKDAKLKEINSLLEEEITPTMQKLKEERSQYLEYQKVQRELDHLTKLFIAYKFVSAQDKSGKASDQANDVKKQVAEMKQQIANAEKESVELEQKAQDLRKKRDEESGGVLEDLEKQLKEKERHESKSIAGLKNLKETVKAEQKRKKDLEKDLKEDRTTLAKREADLEKLQSSFDSLKSAETAGAEALAAAEKKFQALSAGVYKSEEGQEATMLDQLLAAKQEVSSCQTEIKQLDMRLKHERSELKRKRQEMKNTESSYQKDRQTLDKVQKELKNMENELSKLDYEEGKMENLEGRRKNLSSEVYKLRDQLESLKAKNSRLDFDYKNPEPNFDRRRVRGLVCQQFQLKDMNTATALEVAAGGRLYNVIVDTEVTGKKLLERGQLRNRVTIVPLNKIKGYGIDQATLRFAQQLVGKENVNTALSLISYDPELHSAMEWVFGSTLVCKNMDVAKQVTYHDRIQKRCVTLDGEVFDPQGTLTGGSRAQGASILAALQRMVAAQENFSSSERELKEVQNEMNQLKRVSDRYTALKQQLELKRHEADLLKQRVEMSSHHQQEVEVQNIEKSIEEMEARIVECKKLQENGQRKVAEIDEKLREAKARRERELQDAQKEMDKLRSKAEAGRAKWMEKEQEFETIRLEIQELKTSIENAESEIKSAEASMERHTEEGARLEEEVAEMKNEVAKLQAEVRAQKDAINKQNKEIQATMAAKEKLLKDVADKTLEIKQLEHNAAKLQTEAQEAATRVTDLLAHYDWIAEDRQYFGQPNTAYDFKDQDMNEVGRRVAKLEETRDKLARSVNTRAMNRLGRVEEEYADLVRKKRIVETDKAKISAVIRELDEKKKEVLHKAWEQVNKDFGSIFSTLLPGTQARLTPPEGMTVLDGLEVKVAFGGVWKESLSELSGGQRSLVALSLILAMLLFKPAPIYILDEVDAALDLSHTQNIGHMLKTHFKRSQFIVVSLKDGMFNNANMLFRTKFVDGMSTVTRTVQKQH